MKENFTYGLMKGALAESKKEDASALLYMQARM